MSELQVPDRHPWEKLKGETIQAWTAFVVYRDITPPRSLTKAAQFITEDRKLRGVKTGKAESLRTQLAGWAQKWNWQQRIDAFDLYADRRMVEQRLSDRERATLEERQLARAGIRLVAQALAGDPREGIEAISAKSITSVSEAAAALKMFVALRRLADGQATDLVAGAMMLAPAEAKEIFRAWMELSLSFIETDRHDAFIRAANALGT